MECRKIFLKQLKLIMIILLILISTTNLSYATSIDSTPTVESTTQPDTSTEPEVEPHVEMRVTTNTVTSDGSEQVLVECWANNFTKLESIETVFSYDSTILQPSNINGNSELQNLSSIKYDKRPHSSEGEGAFDILSTDILKNSYKFENVFDSKLNIDIFRYLASTENRETVQVVISKKDEEINLTQPEEYILIGTYSFKRIDATKELDGIFTTDRIRIICDDPEIAGEQKDYYRDTENEQNCEELQEFIYQQYGSISGSIITKYYAGNLETGVVSLVNPEKLPRKRSKKTATIYLYKAEDLNIETLKKNGSRAYLPYRKKLIKFTQEYAQACVPDENAQAEIPYVQKVKIEDGAEGHFQISNIEFGTYVIFIDKYNYADYIITNITIDSSNKDIDLGEKTLLAGDINKDGYFNATSDYTAWKSCMNVEGDTTFMSQYNLNFPFDLNDDGKADRNSDKIIFTSSTNAAKLIGTNRKYNIKKCGRI